MAHQIALFCVPQLADTGCLEVDHKCGSMRARCRPVQSRYVI